MNNGWTQILFDASRLMQNMKARYDQNASIYRWSLRASYLLTIKHNDIGWIDLISRRQCADCYRQWSALSTTPYRFVFGVGRPGNIARNKSVHGFVEWALFLFFLPWDESGDSLAFPIWVIAVICGVVVLLVIGLVWVIKKNRTNQEHIRRLEDDLEATKMHHMPEYITLYIQHV